MLELRSLTKKFDRTIAVNKLDLTCKQNEFLVIFGPAGAGKSTTLRLIAGILEPDSGEVYFNGANLKNVPPEQRNMSMAFENYALYSHLSVYENLAFPLLAKKFKDQDIRTRVQEMAAILQISELLERRPGFLSGGQRQRVALGRALIRDAAVYLLDEPISHLDAKLRNRMRGELKAVCAHKEATVVHVTHDYREAMALSDRMTVLNKGRIMQLGTPDEVFHRPANEFVAGFVGDPPMSFVDAEYIEQNEKPQFRLAQKDIHIPAHPGIRAYVKENGLPQSFKIGVRAKDITITSSQDDIHHVGAEVFVTEKMGYQNILIAHIGRTQIRVITPPKVAFNSKDTVWLNLDESNVHVFADGNAVSHPKRETNAGTNSI